MNQIFRYSSYFLFILLCYSCAVKKYVPAGEKLYDGTKVELELKPEVQEKPAALRKKLADLTKPKRNKKFLGRYNKVWWWYVIGESKEEKGFKHWLREQFGEAPVLSSMLEIEWNAENMQSFLASRGYFNSKVTGDTIIDGYKIKTVYHAKVERPYMFGNIIWRLDSSRLSKDILSLPAKESLLKKGERYDADKIKAESQRISSLLKDRGYYYFKPDDILTYVDTNQNNYTASIFLSIELKTTARNKLPFTINKITTVVQPGLSFDSSTAAIVTENDIHVNDVKQHFKPGIFPRAITYRPGSLYSLAEQTKSVSRLNSYGVFRFIRSEYKPASTGNNMLDVYYYTTPSQGKKMQFELGGFFRSNNYNGAQLSVAWRNKNLFRGAELLTLKATGSFEISVNDSLQQNNNWRLGLEASLAIPKFIAPGFSRRNFSFLPRTRIVLSYDRVRRQDLYTEYYAHARYELNWNDTVTRNHKFIPLSLTLYNTANYTNGLSVYRAMEPKTEYTFPTVINAAASYHYFVTKSSHNKKNIFSLLTSIEASGTLIGLIKGNNGQFSTKIGNAFFTQYIRGDADFRYTRKLNEGLFLANRLVIGVSHPYGNSAFLPFNRQFIIGGANSLRGFLPRQLGPGSAKANTNQQTVYPQIGGDYKLEASTELRFPLVGRLKGAVFADAGNIWMKDSILYSQKGVLTSEFYKEIALDGGVGVRLDITLLIIRFDIGLPFYKPWLPPGERWLKQLNVGDPDWRKENLVVNLAIGYPF